MRHLICCLFAGKPLIGFHVHFSNSKFVLLGCPRAARLRPRELSNPALGRRLKSSGNPGQPIVIFLYSEKNIRNTLSLPWKSCKNRSMLSESKYFSIDPRTLSFEISFNSKAISLIELPFRNSSSIIFKIKFSHFQIKTPKCRVPQDNKDNLQ